jgi:hypothetical protein
LEGGHEESAFGIEDLLTSYFIDWIAVVILDFDFVDAFLLIKLCLLELLLCSFLTIQLGFCDELLVVFLALLYLALNLLEKVGEDDSISPGCVCLLL